MGIARLDATQTTKPRATNEVEQNGLNAVVAMVGNTNVMGMDIASQTLEIAVTQIACCHFDTHMMEFGIRAGVKVNEMQRYIKTPTELLTKLLIAHRLLTAQMEVAMGCLYAYAQLALQPPQHEEQRHAISTARESYNILTTINEQFVDRGKTSHSVHECSYYR